MQRNWPPHLVVATLVEQGDRFLCVEERIGDRLVLNQPAGHWDPGESLLDAARRETLEETAWHVELTHLLGVYSHEPPGLGYGFLRFAFVGRPIRHEKRRALDAGIERALWLTRDELAANESDHRSPLVMRCVDDAVAGHRYPLALIHTISVSS